MLPADVKVDVEKTPDLIRCLAALKTDQPKPDDVADDIWKRASRDWLAASDKVKDKDYRMIVKEDGTPGVLMLDKDGRVPKVALTSPWLKALAYKLCGEEPTADSHFACVCTPYVFNMYAGIFGLTGSVGGKAELSYLTKTYKAFKFDKEGDMNPFDDGQMTLPSGVIKYNNDGIHGAEVQFLGRSMPLHTAIMPAATAIAGTALGARTRRPIKGGFIGGMAGALGGMATGNAIEDERRRRNQSENERDKMERLGE